VGDAPVEQRPRGLAKLSGLDRSGPPAPQTLRGAPLHPWTIPNAIGYVRAVLLPVFLILALSSKRGTDPLPATIFAVIAWGDYADGFTARITGQYSRLGALMDPVIDRLLVIFGVIVCWHFALLHRWALDVLVGRELFMLVCGRIALSRGRELRINYIGRLAVLPVMSSLFMGMVALRVAGNVALLIGVAMALAATGLYIRDAAGPSTSG
jgi:phosphatidylglycerophosphate synthase